MEASELNTEDLLAKVSRLEQQLLKRFQNIVALAPVPTAQVGGGDDDDRDTDGQEARTVPDRSQATYNALKMELETTALIRTAREILSLSRQFKEMWLFGQLDTLHKNGDEQGRLNEDREAVGALLEGMITRIQSNSEA